MPTIEQRRRQEYTARINRVLDYIEAHLTEDLSLEQLARVACFSPYHFHRLFRALVGEPLGAHVQRLRVERAARLLQAEPSTPITNVALECGYGSSAAFSRAFRDAFGMSPSEWRSAAESKIGIMKRNPGEALGKPWKELTVEWIDAAALPTTQTWRMVMTTEKTSEKGGKVETKLEAKVEVRELPEKCVAYLRHIGPYAGDGELFGRLYGQLMRWAGPRGLHNPSAQMLTIYYDDPNVTDSSKLRMDVCVTVPPETEVSGDVGRMTLTAGRYAVARFEIASDEYGAAWDAVMGGWFPESGYVPDNGPCFEICANDPAQHPEGKHIVDICVPVKPLD